MQALKRGFAGENGAWILLASAAQGSEFPVVQDEIAASRWNPPCPWLPSIAEWHDFTITRRHGAQRDAAFYGDALRYAQSLWISAKPAQAILQLDKAWMAELPRHDPVLAHHPPPYQALAWILQQAASGKCGYLGNPVRHFQHLASRISGPNAGIRSWRAWLCMHLAERLLPRANFPRDGRQLAREGLWVPSLQRSLNEVAACGWADEALIFTRAFIFCNFPASPGFLSVDLT